MPDDYYVSQYSGEEIDALLASAGAGSVRYDAAQTLTDEQKTQARGNINAASGGFGLGETQGKRLYATNDLNSITTPGWYWWTDMPSNAPIGNACMLVYSAYDGDCYVQEIHTYLPSGYAWSESGAVITRQIYTTYIGKWEWVNPPMLLGVEYRTTERYMGKPVYVKVVNCGQISDGKEIEHGISNMDTCIMAQGLMSGLALPRVLSHDLSNEWSAYISQVYSTKIRFECGTSVVGNNIAAILKYTKTTD